MKIPGDYQFKALTKGFYVQRNWHDNKLYLVELLGLCDKNKSLVDIGCGSGNFLFRYGNEFKSLVGLDNSREALDFVESRVKDSNVNNITVVEGDLSKEFSSQEFDIAVCMEVIEHFSMLDLRGGVFSNICDLVKPGGMLFITTPNKRSVWPIIEKVLDFFRLVPKLANEQHFSSFTEEDLKAVLEEHGFDIVYIGSFNHLSPFVFPSFLRKLVLNAEVKYIRKYGPLLYAVAVKEPDL